MKPLVLLPLVSCLIYTVLATVILVRDSRQPASRLGAAVCLCAGWWALCEVLWTTASDASVVLALVKASSLGWMLIGAFMLHLFLHITGHPARHAGRHPLMPCLYALGGLCITTDFATSLMHTGVVQTSWGWAYRVGPFFTVAYLLAAVPIIAGITMAVRQLGEGSSRSERRQVAALLVGITVPLTIATWTDFLLPLSGRAAPRFGTSSVTLLMGAIAWGFHRYGYSLLAPGNFAWEILTTIQDGVALIRPDGRIRVANPGLEQMLHAGPRELEDRHMGELFGLEPVPGEELREREATLRPLDGEGTVPVSLSSSILRDKTGDAVGLVLIARDLREVASLRNRLVVSDRLAAVGQLAAGIAHEINNPVAYVRANLTGLASLLESLESKLPDELQRVLDPDLREGKELVGESIEGVERVASIVRDVKEFSHSGGADREPVELCPLLESVLRVAAPQCPSGCRVESDLAEGPTVRGSAQELKQVFLNLVINAFQSCGGEGLVRVSLKADGEEVRVRVEDTGCGMGPEILERIFDPFFTTKPVGEGTGLGLSISYQIVQAHDGEMSVSSQPGRGTRFEVRLPVG